jgi:hypothetical protein
MPIAEEILVKKEKKIKEKAVGPYQQASDSSESDE